MNPMKFILKESDSGGKEVTVFFYVGLAVFFVAASVIAFKVVHVRMKAAKQASKVAAQAKQQSKKATVPTQKKETRKAAAHGKKQSTASDNFLDDWPTERKQESPKQEEKPKEEPPERNRKEQPVNRQNAAMSSFFTAEVGMVENGDVGTPFIVPYGTEVRVKLMGDIETNNYEQIAIVTVVEEVIHNAKRIIPANTRVYAKISQGQQRDRAILTFYRMRLADGTNFPITGTAIDLDGVNGIKGTLINDMNRKIMLSLAANFVAAVPLSLQETETNSVTGTDQISSNARNAMLSGLGSASSEYGEVLAREMEKLTPYLRINAGKELILFLEEDLDVGKPLTDTSFTYMGRDKEGLWLRDFTQAV